jgi:hypothetical protein
MKIGISSWLVIRALASWCCIKYRLLNFRALVGTVTGNDNSDSGARSWLHTPGSPIKTVAVLQQLNLKIHFARQQS